MVSQEANIPSPRDTVRITNPPNNFFNENEQYFVEGVRDFRVVVKKLGTSMSVTLDKVEIVPKYWLAVRCDDCGKIICEVDSNTYQHGSVRCLCRSCKATVVVRGDRD